jgi:hypothetical protein
MIAQPKDFKQVSNMQQKFRKLYQEIDEIIRLDVVCHNTFRYQSQVPEKQALFYTYYTLKILCYNKVWWFDMTFNMWQGYVTSVITQNTNLINSSKRHPIASRFMYIHERI